jgi:phosphoribosylanthranilate isomerase
MPIWIKICANTSLQDALVAAEAGADAVGFVFAPSPRRVSPEQVAAIVPHLPRELEKIGVFVGASLDEIETAVRVSGLTGVQLHSDTDSESATLLRERIGAELRILRVVHFSAEAAEQVASLVGDPHVDGILIDSRTATAVGGTGIRFDWSVARETLFDSPRTRLIAAGGLSPANVAEAIATLDPWGVDVASGVEASPGRKDPLKVREFIRRAREASHA